jgi:hypothetical protein
MLLLTGVAAIMLRRRLPAGITPLVLWVLGYTLTLSLAYYTPRAALLPVLTAIPALAAVIWRFPGQRTHSAVSTSERSSQVALIRHLAVTAAGVLLLSGYIVASRAARADYAMRMRFAQVSVTVQDYLRQRGLEAKDVVVCDARVLPLSDNPWCSPYPRFEHGWLDDSAFRKGQRTGLLTYSPLDMEQDRPPLPKLVLCPDPPPDNLAKRLLKRDSWTPSGTVEHLVVYEFSGTPASLPH